MNIHIGDRGGPDGRQQLIHPGWDSPPGGARMGNTKVTGSGPMPVPRARETSGTDRHDAALAAIVRSSPDAVIAKTLEGVITDWNAGATSIYGYTAQEMIGRDVEVLIPREHLDEERERRRRIAAGTSESA